MLEKRLTCPIINRAMLEKRLSVSLKKAVNRVIRNVEFQKMALFFARKRCILLTNRILGIPYGDRTRVLALKKQCPDH